MPFVLGEGSKGARPADCQRMLRVCKCLENKSLLLDTLFWRLTSFVSLLPDEAWAAKALNVLLVVGLGFGVLIGALTISAAQASLAAGLHCGSPREADNRGASVRK